MNKFVIATDSCSDLPNTFVKENDIQIIPLTVEINGQTYAHYPDERELKITDFYQLMRDKKVAKTSLVNVGTFLEFFEPFLKAEKEILYIGFSSALSGTLQSARTAALELKETYPNGKILIVDTLAASMGEGLLIHHAVGLRNKGQNIEQVQQWLEENKLHLIHLFTVDDLGTLRRGGRLSDTKAIIGQILRVKPILHVSNEGRLVPIRKARGRQFSLDSMLELVDQKIENPKGQTVFISHGDSIEDAKYVGNKIIEKHGVKEVIYNHIGPIIGAHAGPGTIAVFFLGNER
ncbi:MAG: DegV family protein [Acholeplasmataceae bacterium]|jgi:DegV family protein with EDD domain|nr:DegV family protein [Acholeplasmataceae bacterium]